MNANRVEGISLLLVRELHGFALELEMFADEDLIWKTLPGVANSAGTLTLHACGNLQHFVGAVLGGTSYIRDRQHEFSARGVSREKLLAEIERTVAVVRTVLPGLSEDVLTAPFPDVLGGVRPTAHLFLLHLLSHLSHHLGQVGYLRRVLTGENRTSGAVSLQALPDAAVGPSDPSGTEAS